MAKIAISYRRSDSQDITGRIFDRLTQQYGRSTVFRDIDNIQPGIDFRVQIAEALRTTDVLLVVVGPKWLGRVRGIESRIDNEADPVRVEVEIALKRGIPIIPVLVGGTKMPETGHLPAGLRDFAYRHAVTVDSGRDFDHHVEGLIRALDQILTGRSDRGAEPSSTMGVAQPIASTFGGGPVHIADAPSSAKTPQRARFVSLRNSALVGGLGVIIAMLALIVFFQTAKKPAVTQQAAVQSQPAPTASEAGANIAISSNTSEAERAWAVTKDVTSIAVLNDFIRQFGDTPYGSMARARVQELQRSQAAAMTQPSAPLPPPQPPPQPRAADNQMTGPPSFDCGKAHAPDELEICRNGMLASLDRQLDALYAAVRDRSNGDRQIALRDEQRSWLRQRAACLSNDACLLDTYRSRIAQLRSWQ
jgi:uncharacterized protein YecT (DUF1311 family)